MADAGASAEINESVHSKHGLLVDDATRAVDPRLCPSPQRDKRTVGLLTTAESSAYAARGGLASPHRATPKGHKTFISCTAEGSHFRGQ